MLEKLVENAENAFTVFLIKYKLWYVQVHFLQNKHLVMGSKVGAPQVSQVKNLGLKKRQKRRRLKR